ncbi:MAG: TonB-dependent receptor [Acidobacteria bacterium]|nr:TonB-dependent receptor [Acidobacteriota bacterium]MBI3655722.1 TonB-dependent receptor [Acidobacteriota bacterium]
MKIVNFVFSTVMALALLWGTAFGGSIKGTVHDETGSVIPNAKVTLILATGSSLTQPTNGRGEFNFEPLKAGSYQVVVGVTGFRTDITQVVGLANDQTRNLDLRLQISAIPEEVIVTAARTETPLTQVGASATVLTARDIEDRQAQTVLEVLRAVPGLSVVQSGRRGGITSIFARGGDSKYNLVLVDGIQVNDFGGFFDFGHLPTDNIAGIEVLRGAQSALYGANAIGAVVNVITKRGAGEPHFTVSGEGGSYATRRFTLGGNGLNRGFDWGFNLSRLDTDGVVRNDDYRNQNLSLNLGYRFAEDRRLQIKFNALNNEGGAPGPFGPAPWQNPAPDLIERFKNNDFIYGASYDHGFSARLKQRFVGSVVNRRGFFASSYGPSFDNNFRGVFKTESDYALSRHNLLSFGMEYERERERNTFITDRNNRPFDLFRNNFGYFVENKFEWDGRLFVNTGLRLENIRTRLLPGFTTIPRTSVVSVNPKMSAAYYLRPLASAGNITSTKLHGSFGTGIRAPSGGFEIAFSNPINSPLRPERTRSFDIGLEQGLIGERVLVGATYFYNRYKDLIIVFGNEASRRALRSDNIANARAQGVELSLSLRPTHSLTLGGAYTFLDSTILALTGTDRAQPPYLVGDPLLRRARHSGSYFATWRNRRLTLQTDAALRGMTRDAHPIWGLPPFGAFFVNGGYIKAGAGFSYELANGLQLYGRIDNMANQKYEEVFGFRSLRINFVAGLRAQFGGESGIRLFSK